jgi:hypothetical protein
MLMHVRLRLRLAQYIPVAYRRQPELPGKFLLVVPNYEGIAPERADSSKSVYTPQDVAHIISYAGAVRSPSFFLFDTVTSVH